MNFSSTKKEIFRLARAGRMSALRKYMRDYYTTVGFPTVVAKYPFVARARVNLKGEIFCKRSQLSYNPVRSKIQLQRGNFKREQVFYGAVPIEHGGASQGISPDHSGSFCAHAALLECGMQYVKKRRPPKREYFTVCMFIVNRPLNVVILPFARASIEKNAHLGKAAKIHSEIFEQHFAGKSTREKSRNMRALEFISECFCQNHNKTVYYRITATYCDIIREIIAYNKMPFDGIVYPSAITKPDGVNIVLRKELADDGTLTLDYIMMQVKTHDLLNRKHVRFGRASNDVFADAEGNFHIGAIY